jgi:hypothetical protein
VVRGQWVVWCCVGQSEVASNDPAAEGAMLGTDEPLAALGPQLLDVLNAKRQLHALRSSMGSLYAPLPRS